MAPTSTVDVRVGVEHLAAAGRRSFACQPKCAAMKLRLRMLPEQVVAFGHQLVEGDLPRLVVAAIREQRELEPALVVIVERLEELLRFGRYG